MSRGQFAEFTLEARDKSLNVVWQGSADQDLYVNYLKDRKDVVIERNKLGDQYFMDYYKKSDGSFGAYARIE